MTRKTFIKSSGALVAGSLIPDLISCQSRQTETNTTGIDSTSRHNWAGNYEYSAATLSEPRTVDEVVKILKGPGRFKALGSRHCFNNIADSPEEQVSTEFLNEIGPANTKNKTITVGAGVKYGQLAPVLHQQGFALHNLASLPHISIGGACATATHGSGFRNGNLATPVSAVELVTGSGEVVQLSREKDPAVFDGVVVGLGALGVITKVTLDVQPTFNVAQYVYQDLPLASLRDHFREILTAGYSVSLFTDWLNDSVSQVWIKQRVNGATKDPGADFFGAKMASRNLHPIVALSAENCTEQMGVAGAWYERFPHFKMGFTPSSGEELQAEYFVPFENGLDAILALEKKKELIYPQLMISEIRTVAADRLWMSPAYGQDMLAIHFTLKQNWPEVSRLLPVIEAELEPYQVRPHWGKLFTLAPNLLIRRYERFEEFLQIAKKFDPEGKFRNPYLDKYLYAESD